MNRPDHDASDTRSIDDYAIIGDSRSAALISRTGAIEWLCWPRFDSPSWFAAMLGTENDGHFTVRADGTVSTTRRYVGDTNVLETTFHTASGIVRVTDLMPVDSEDAKRRALFPQHELLRRIECVDGEAVVEVAYAPRPDYARAAVPLHDRGRLGIFCAIHDEVLVLRGDVPLDIPAQSCDARGRIHLRAGDRRYLSLVFSKGEPVILPQLGAAADARIDATLAWWSAWAARCRYDGPFRDAVVRSALALKLMIYAPAGAIVAAPTTSLPEWPGGVRNWDYRYCWLRDASLAVQVLIDLGFTTEAESFLSWLIHTTRITWPELRVMYTVYGDRNVPERNLDHLSGFAASRPVRVGNGAGEQLQLDVYGEVVDAVYQFVQRGGHLDRVTRRMIVDLGETVCKRWREPDEGIWEIRSGRQQHTYSKAMCWVALDRLLSLHDSGHVHVPTERFARERDAIKDEIERRGFNTQLGSYVNVLDGDRLDASLLKIGWHGCVEPTCERMRGTLEQVRARLGRNGLVYRYRDIDDGIPGDEGTFGICSAWAVSAQALTGDVDGAADALMHLLSFSNDVGLFAEEIDPVTGEALGNFPQAFTHVGIIDAALVIAAASEAGPEGGPTRRHGRGPGSATVGRV